MGELPPAQGAARLRIQAGGALVAAEGPDAPIQCVAGDAAAWLGAPAETLLGETLGGLFDGTSVRRLRACWCDLAAGEEPAPLALRAVAATAAAVPAAAVCWLHRNSQGLLVLEWEPSAEPEGWLPAETVRKLASHCRQAASPAEAAQRLVRGVQAAVGFGRAALVAFTPEGGRVVAEAGDAKHAAPSGLGDDAPFLKALSAACRARTLNCWAGRSVDASPALQAPDGKAPLDLAAALLRPADEGLAAGFERLGAGSAAAVALDDGRGAWGCLLLLDSATRRLSADWRLALRGGIAGVAFLRPAEGGTESAPATVSAEAEAERRRMEAMMHASEAAIHVGSWEIDLADHSIRWSAEMFRIFGLEPGPTAPTLDFVFDSFAPGDRPWVRETLDRCARFDEPMDLEAQIAPGGGEPRWIRVAGRARREAGLPVKVYGVVQDVHDRKLVELALRASEARTRVIVDTMLDAVASIDESGILQRVNRATERIFGYAEGELVGRSVSMLMPLPERDEHDAHLAEYLRTGVAKVIGVGREVVGRRKDGSTFPLELSVAEMRVDGKRQFLGLMRDVTERRRMQDSLQAALAEAEGASQAKSRFLANMSHELRTPMNAILGLTDLALASNLTEDQRVDLQIVKESGQALLRLLDDLLDFARLEGRTVALRNAPFSLRGCLQRLCRTLAPHAFNKGLEWICDLASSLPEQAIGDEGRFEQLIRNLLDNALKYTPQGSVELRAWAERTALDQCVLHCEIRDTGPGIAPEDQERIFEVFTQLDSTLRRRAAGAGLGLAICRELARVLGGKLELQSAEGAGSQFTAVLPFAVPPLASVVAAAAALSAEPNAQPASSLSAAPHLGLLASPSAATARVFHAAAARFDAKLEAVESLEAALQRQQTLADSRTPASFAFLDEALYAQASPDQLRRFAAGFPAGAVALVGRFGLPRRSGEVPLADLRIERVALLPIIDAEFQATLRALWKAGLAPPQASAAAAAAGERPLQVLLAEDTLANQRVIVRFLERRGHKVVTALNGREALDRLEEKKFDLVLMDVQMPVMDGLTATREIRQREKVRRGPATPVVAITAHAFPEERPFFIDAGMDDVLVKPVNFAQMDALLQRIRREQIEAPKE